MTKINVSLDKDSFQDVISQVAGSGERAIIEQEGQAIAAIISYSVSSLVLSKFAPSHHSDI